MEHIMIPVPVDCPPTPKKGHMVHLNGYGMWEQVFVQSKKEVPTPPTPKRNHLQIYTGEHWMFVKKMKI